MSPNQANRPNKRIKEAHIVSTESSRAPSPTEAPASDETLLCLQLLFADLPPSLATGGDDVHAFREVWMAHGFRTSLVTAPTKAVSVFLDSCKMSSDCPEREAGRAFLLSCIGMHPQQKKLEEEYSLLKSAYCLNLFLTRLRCVRRADMEDDRVRNILMSWETDMQHIVNELKSGITDASRFRNIVSSSSHTLSQLLSKLTEIDRSLRTDQLLREYNRICYENCTLPNACMHRWLFGQVSSVKKQTFRLDKVYFQCSPVGSYMPERERVTIHMSDDNDKQSANDTLIFLPSLNQILKRGDTSCHPLDAVVEGMIQTTWDDLLKNGYYIDQARKEQLSDPLEKFYLSGLLAGRDSNMPILLTAHFTPTYPLSLYLHGTTGAGKSSLVRNLVPAINAAISTYCDPELLVRFVKQNLNKPFETLQLELELRPNNNDYSVMSIIQGRRMTFSQSKPGLVLVALEEMPSNLIGNDPNQLEVSKLISMRFSGRKGEFKDGSAPRNSAKRGISGDATIINIFTSNYDLEQPCLDALQRLEMFENLQVIHMVPLRQDRKAFAMSYLAQRVRESSSTVKVNINIDVPLGDGDARPLVRYLRMLSFYIHAMVLHSTTKSASNTVDFSVTFDSATNTTIVTASNGTILKLRSGSFDNIHSVTPLTPDPRSSEVVERLQTLHPDLKHSSELCQVLDFYFAKTLAPTVVLSTNKRLIQDLVNILSRSNGVHGISNINPSHYKIMKSLYDASDTPNLRDDILDILHDNSGPYVATELRCYTTDAQLQIRELIEDTPSMTAFSTERSALQKDGLFFGVFVKDSITAEIKSRASLVI